MKLSDIIALSLYIVTDIGKSGNDQLVALKVVVAEELILFLTYVSVFQNIDRFHGARQGIVSSQYLRTGQRG